MRTGLREIAKVHRGRVLVGGKSASLPASDSLRLLVLERVWGKIWGRCDYTAGEATCVG